MIGNDPREGELREMIGAIMIDVIDPRLVAATIMMQ